MKKQEFIRLAEKYASGNCNRGEKAIVEAFFDKMQEKRMDWRLTAEEEKRLRILKSIKRSIKTEEGLHTLPAVPWRQLTGIAASVIAVIGFALLYYFSFGVERYVEQIARRGERKEILLSDGTKVYLNSESSLKYPHEFSDLREVTLTGEAFFKVARDPEKPFVVKSDNIETTVLGTSFNINTYSSSEIRVSVNSGKVQVENKSVPGEKVFLTRNEQVVYDKKSRHFTTTQTDAEKYVAWTNNIILMENNTLREVSDILEKWYEVEIVFENSELEKRTITGKYKAGELRDILESIRFLKQIDYEFVSPKKIMIREINDEAKIAQ